MSDAWDPAYLKHKRRLETYGKFVAAVQLAQRRAYIACINSDDPKHREDYARAQKWLEAQK